MEPRVVVAIAGMSLLTYLPRLVPTLLLAGRSLPQPVLQWLRLLPPAILGALVAQAVLVHEGQPDVSFSNPVLVPACITALVAWSSRNLAWTIISGLVAAALYNWFI